MSKDTVDFPWRNAFDDGDSGPSPAPETATPVLSPKERAWKWMRIYKTPLCCLAGILFLTLLLDRKKSSETESLSAVQSAGKTLFIMVPVVGFSKGAVLEPTLLKSVIAPSSTFSKSQLLSVFTEEDIRRVDGRIVAKKDLAPYRPIFWSSLELRRPAPAKPKKVQILSPQNGDPTP